MIKQSARKGNSSYQSTCVSQDIRSLDTRGTEKQDTDAMTPPRNLLILKGSVPWEETLRLLDQLLKRVVEIKKLKSTPQPWQVFSLICASGDKRYVKSTLLGSRRSHSTVHWLFSSVAVRRVQMNVVRS
jgi:hypothetical protein